MSSGYKDYIQKEQNDLAVQYLPAVKAMAYRLKERLPASVEMSDLVSIGVEELVKLSRRYDKDINDSFWGFAKTRVYGSMLDYLRSLDTVSRGNRKIIKMVDAAVSKYFNEHQEEPTNEQLADMIDESIDKIKDARLAAEIYQVMPLNDQFSAYERDTISEDIEQEELVEVIQSILGDLSQREQMIIQLYYFEELSLKEISQILNITQSRISQIHKSVLRKVRDSAGDIFG
jgi:RNA polymerase sigma factor for flagellar operon FliA